MESNKNRIACYINFHTYGQLWMYDDDIRGPDKNDLVLQI